MDETNDKSGPRLDPESGEPALHWAARVGDVAAIRRLVAAGADVNAVAEIRREADDEAVWVTPLMAAAWSRDGATEETVAVLLELGADPKVVLDERSAATFALIGRDWRFFDAGGDAKRANLLLQAGSPLPTDGERSNRLLCAIATTGDSERLRLLLGSGLNAKGHWDPAAARETHSRRFGDVAEQVARRLEAFAYLPAESLASMAESIEKDERARLERYSSAPSSYNIPLFCAAESGDVNCVRLLLEAGADVQRRDSSKRTAMFYAGSVEMIRVLLEAGLSLEDADEFGWTPLTGAVGDGEESLPRVAALIEAGANVNATHDRGYTVFMSAVGSLRYPALLRLLAASGADVHAVSDLGYNAFHAAIDVDGGANAEESVRDTFGYLKELGVNIEHRNSDDHTPLARAIDLGYGLEASVLCDLGADPNAVCTKYERGSNARGPVEVPLLFHAISGSALEKDVKVAALLRAGADPLVQGADGATPLMRVVASLCRDAADCEASYQAFFAGLGRVKLEGTPLPGGRDQFVAAVSPVIRAYVERFAGEIPVSKASEYAEEWRREKIACIVLLAAYEAWARREK